MRIFTAMLMTETNSFAPMVTGYRAYADLLLVHGRREAMPNNIGTGPLLLWAKMGAADGHEVVHSLAAFGPPAGNTVRKVYEDFREEILRDAAETGPYDVILLNLHGAMIADGYDDCEGDLLARLRDLVGPAVKIGVELDSHCHLTDLMLRSADVIVIYKEYPHTDIMDRAREVYRITLDTALGKVAPVMATADLPMVNLWSTVVQPMRGFVDRMIAREGQDGILSLSFAHGFPWGDVAPGVARPLAVVDGDAGKARRIAQEMADELWAMREGTAFKGLSIDEAFDLALAAEPGLVVIADTADNTGGGAAGDSTFVLRRAMERGIGDIAIGPLWDPVAAQFCIDAGVGATIPLRIGGKCGPSSGDPVDVRATVRACAEDYKQSFGRGTVVPLGASAWIEIDGVHVVLCSLRMQCYGPQVFTGLGVPLDRMRIAVPKSANHFRAGFEPLAVQILFLNGPGAIPGVFEALEFTNRTNQFWPRVADPFAAV